ncbi:MAG: hypothetical protein SFT93_05975 [Rickettsiaceae bacterium]|nr:hypothetical protein [Rickettsiaceae bacterium]
MPQVVNAQTDLSEVTSNLTELIDYINNLTNKTRLDVLEILSKYPTNQKKTKPEELCDGYLNKILWLVEKTSSDNFVKNASDSLRSTNQIVQNISDIFSVTQNEQDLSVQYRAIKKILLLFTAAIACALSLTLQIQPIYVLVLAFTVEGVKDLTGLIFDYHQAQKEATKLTLEQKILFGQNLGEMLTLLKQLDTNSKLAENNAFSSLIKNEKNKDLQNLLVGFQNKFDEIRKDSSKVMSIYLIHLLKANIARFDKDFSKVMGENKQIRWAKRSPGYKLEAIKSFKSRDTDADQLLVQEMQKNIQLANEFHRAIDLHYAQKQTSLYNYYQEKENDNKLRMFYHHLIDKEVISVLTNLAENVSKLKNIDRTKLAVSLEYIKEILGQLNPAALAKPPSA